MFWTLPLFLFHLRLLHFTVISPTLALTPNPRPLLSRGGEGIGLRCLLTALPLPTIVQQRYLQSQTGASRKDLGEQQLYCSDTCSGRLVPAARIWASNNCTAAIRGVADWCQQQGTTLTVYDQEHSDRVGSFSNTHTFIIFNETN